MVLSFFGSLDSWFAVKTVVRFVRSNKGAKIIIIKKKKMSGAAKLVKDLISYRFVTRINKKE